MRITNAVIAAAAKEQQDVSVICGALDRLKAAGVTIQQFGKDNDINANLLYQMRYSHRANTTLCSKILSILQTKYPKQYNEAMIYYKREF